MTDTTPMGERDQEQLRKHVARAWDVWTRMIDGLAILAIPDDLLNQRLGVLHVHLRRIWELSGAGEPGLWSCDCCGVPIGADEERIVDYVGDGVADEDGGETAHRVTICVSCWESGGDDEAAREHPRLVMLWGGRVALIDADDERTDDEIRAAMEAQRDGDTA